MELSLGPWKYLNKILNLQKKALKLKNTDSVSDSFNELQIMLIEYRFLIYFIKTF